MRTTLTLDPDVDAKLRALARDRRISFKAAVNAALRRGLADDRETARTFNVDASPLGLRPGIDLDRALALAGQLEDEETIRKLDVRK